MRTSILKALGFTLVASFLLLAGAVTWFVWDRGNAIDEITALALEVRPGAPTEALEFVAASGDTELRLRNRAIWVLGELRDERALPLLESLIVGEECDHERYVCQREVRKAIEKISGEGIDIVRPFVI